MQAVIPLDRMSAKDSRTLRTRVGRLGCGGSPEGSLDRTTSRRRHGRAAEDERQEDVAGDATARQVARVERLNLRAPCRVTRGTSKGSTTP
eukprot:scaffold7040_cov66-Phaeocystis_antarctica.AAC.6